VPIRGRSCLVVSREIFQIFSLTGESKAAVKAVRAKINGKPRTGKLKGKIRPARTRSRKTRKGRPIRHQFIFSGGRGISSRAFSRSTGLAFQPRIKITAIAPSRQGMRRGRKKPTYGILIPAAVIMAQRLTGGAAALNPAIKKMIAATFVSGSPIYFSTMATSEPVIRTVTLPAPVNAPGIRSKITSRRKRTTFCR